MTTAEQLEPLKFEDNALVQQANLIIRAQQDNLTLLECKLIKLCIANCMGNTEKVNLKFTVNAKDLADALGIDKKDCYRDLDKMSTSIMRKIIVIKDTKKKGSKPNYKKLHWVDSFEYCEGSVNIRLSEELRPYVAGLDQLFTKYPFEEILSLPTVYSIRLYELLASWQNMKFRKSNPQSKVSFTLPYLRTFFNCEDKYKRPYDFIKNVITPSVEAIRERTLMPLHCEIDTDYGSIVGVTFDMNYDEEQAQKVQKLVLPKSLAKKGR